MLWLGIFVLLVGFLLAGWLIWITASMDSIDITPRACGAVIMVICITLSLPAFDRHYSGYPALSTLLNPDTVYQLVTQGKHGDQKFVILIDMDDSSLRMYQLEELLSGNDTCYKLARDGPGFKLKAYVPGTFK